MEKRCEKMCKKLLLARILALRAAFWTVRGASGAARERFKSDPRRPQELRKVDFRGLCDALGRSWVVFYDLFRILSILDIFLIDFSLILARCWFVFAWLSLWLLMKFALIFAT